MAVTKKLKINSDFIPGYKKDAVVCVNVDSGDIPLDPFWRQRLKDAVRDNCCELLADEKPKKNKKIKEGGENDN